MKTQSESRIYTSGITSLSAERRLGQDDDTAARLCCLSDVVDNFTAVYLFVHSRSVVCTLLMMCRNVSCALLLPPPNEVILSRRRVCLFVVCLSVCLSVG